MKGTGRVFLRGQTYWVAYYLRGKEHRESSHSSDIKVAEKILKARLREVAADQIGARTFTTPQASRLTIAELVEALKADFELRGKASRQNLSVLNRVDSDFGTFRAVDLTAEAIDGYIEQRLTNGDAKASINRTTQLLGQCYALAVRREHLSRAPFIRHLSEAGNARQGFFSEPELAAAVSHLPEDLRDFVRFAAATGMRKGECCSLTWSDVEGDVLTLRGENAKNGEARSVPLVGELAEIIERRQSMRQVNENGRARMIEYIFHRDGEPVAEFRKSWQSACLKSELGRFAWACTTKGCPGFGEAFADYDSKVKTVHRCPVYALNGRKTYFGRIFHDLRRSAVRNMTRAGTPQTVAMKISGHKTASMFQRYNITDDADLRTALERTEQYRATAAKQKVVAMR